VAGSGVRLVDSASAVADAVIGDHAELIDTSHRDAGDVHIQLTDASDRFLRIATAILGRDPPDAGCRMPDAGCRMPDAGCRMPDAGCRMPDATKS